MTKKDDVPGFGVLSLYILEGSVVALALTRALAWNGPAQVVAVASIAAVALTTWASGWPTYALTQELAADAAQRAAHPGATFKGRMAPRGAAGALWTIARATVGLLFGLHLAIYNRTSAIFRPPLALVWLGVGAAAIAFVPHRVPPAQPAKQTSIVDEAPVVVAPVDPYACPTGAEKKGAPPPAGREVWCEVGGKKNGPAKKWHDDASEHLALEGAFVDDKRDGVWKSYYSSGRPQNEGTFKNGVPDGHHVAWDERGKKILDVTYADGVEVKR